MLRLAAVVVTYHPDASVLDNLRELRGQVETVFLVDNGSAAEELALLREEAAELGAKLLENGDNLGIAAALNRGIRAAEAAGFELVMLFDQDSRVTPGFVCTMQSAWERLPPGPPAAILVPRYLDRRFGHVLPPPNGVTGTLNAATTSGSLMPVSVFAHAGYFAEELFIDGVDYEYSLRVRRLGYVIRECPEAVLLHSPGSPTWHRLLGSKPFQAANYSPVRRYYQERNKIWVTRRYWRQFLPFCLAQFAISLKDLLKIVLVEPGKGEKLRAFARGIRDGLRGVTGRLASE